MKVKFEVGKITKKKEAGFKKSESLCHNIKVIQPYMRMSAIVYNYF